MKFYKTMPVLYFFGNEVWIPNNKIGRRIHSAEMTISRGTKGCTKIKPYMK